MYQYDDKGGWNQLNRESIKHRFVRKKMKQQTYYFQKEKQGTHPPVLLELLRFHHLSLLRRLLHAVLPAQAYYVIFFSWGCFCFGLDVSHKSYDTDFWCEPDRGWWPRERGGVGKGNSNSRTREAVQPNRN